MPANPAFPTLSGMEHATKSLTDRKIAACIPAEWDAFVIYSLSKGAYYRADSAFLNGFTAKSEEAAHLWAFNEAKMIADSLHDCGEDAAIIKATR